MRRSVGLETASDTGRASIGPRDEQGINDKRGMLHVEPRRLTANMWLHMLCTSGVALWCVCGHVGYHGACRREHADEATAFGEAGLHVDIRALL